MPEGSGVSVLKSTAGGADNGRAIATTKPEVVTVKVPALPTVKVVWLGLVNEPPGTVKAFACGREVKHAVNTSNKNAGKRSREIILISWRAMTSGATGLKTVGVSATFRTEHQQGGTLAEVLRGSSRFSSNLRGSRRVTR